MQIKTIVIVVGLLGMASLTTTAAEMKVVNSIQGRAGIHTAVRAEPERPTIALSKQGKGVGTESERVSQEPEREAHKAVWHNPSRQPINVTAHN